MQTLPRKPRKASATAPQSPGAAAARAPGQVRIIGGQWKRTRLDVASKSGLRPTPDRVRETVFNWLGQDLTGWRCLDAFAGTGALGLEAASRGAREVLLVERDPALVLGLKEVQARLAATTVQVVRGDGMVSLKQCAAASLDVVFLDPPFDSTLFEAALQEAARVIQPEGYVYLETPRMWDDAVLAPFGLQVYRYLRAGAVHAHLLRPAPTPGRTA